VKNKSQDAFITYGCLECIPCLYMA